MTTQRILTADKVVTVETVVTEQDRVIDFDDIVEAMSVEYDNWMTEAPWESCDGLEHDVERANYDCDDDRRGSRGWTYCDGRRECIHITISDEQLEEWGCYEYYHASGCSKQVARELAAQNKRNTLDQLVQWYSNGWEWYTVGGEFEEYSAYIGGVDSYEYGEELRYEMAADIAAQMEKDGFIVENQHDPYSYTKRAQLEAKLQRNKTAYVVHPR